MKKLTIILIALTLTTLSIAQTKEEKASFKVFGVCGMCKTRIETALKIDGISAATWNPDSKMLKVKFQPEKISIDSIHKLINIQGYDTYKYKGSKEAHDLLPKCCQSEKE